MQQNSLQKSSGEEAFVPDILYEDNHLIVINKPAPMLSQSDASGQISLQQHIKDYIKKRDDKPGNVFLGLVQRLDKPVSGAIVFAKTSKGAKRISEQIRERRVLKFYLAVTSVPNNFPDALMRAGNGWIRCHHHLLRKKDKTFVAQQPTVNTQEAILEIKTLFVNPAHGVHLIRLITGRKHQIRAQLAELGMAIVGDTKYGSRITFGQNRIALHSCLLKMNHPTRQEPLTISCSPPESMVSLHDDEEKERMRASLEKALVELEQA